MKDHFIIFFNWEIYNVSSGMTTYIKFIFIFSLFVFFSQIGFNCPLFFQKKFKESQTSDDAQRRDAIRNLMT